MIDRRVLERGPSRRWPAFVALGVGVLAAIAVVFLFQHERTSWKPVGTPEIVSTVPKEAAIGLFAVRADDDRLVIVGLSRGIGSRCLSIQFSVDGQPGRSAPVLGVDCRRDEIAGRGISVADDRAVRVYAAGKLLEDVRAADLDACGRGRNLCAMVFDRHAERLELETRRRESRETDRDDGLLAVLQSGGRATETRGAKNATPRDAFFGDVTAQLWRVTTEVRGDADPEPAEVIGALMTRRPKGFSVIVDDRRISGSTRSLVVGGDGSFVED
ncbi:MAG: hypothetical protein Q7T55_04880 [Solirubrobacteraceae bacterium]|nr:hypothetical protein [Solirubrobacteraceae bacterium]